MINKTLKIGHSERQGSTILVLVGICIILFSAGFGSATLESLGTFKQGSNVRIVQVCSDATSINISSISYPNSTVAINAIEMVFDSDGEFHYDFNLTSNLGKHDVRGVANGCDRTFSTYFDVTPSGFERADSGSGIVIIGFLLLSIIIAVTFLIAGFKMENVVVRGGFITFSVIIFSTAILFMVVSFQQVLYGYSNIVSGAETFWFVAKILLGIGLLAFFIFVFGVLYRAWRVKRGLMDE